jgi:hypothetical protein
LARLGNDILSHLAAHEGKGGKEQRRGMNKGEAKSLAVLSQKAAKFEQQSGRDTRGKVRDRGLLDWITEVRELVASVCPAVGLACAGLTRR